MVIVLMESCLNCTAHTPISAESIYRFSKSFIIYLTWICLFYKENHGWQFDLFVVTIPVLRYRRVFLHSEGFDPIFLHPTVTI